ncbi:MAG: helix-turn-helix domain-containing protein [Oscillospiraceae bacterium]|nr:helix-turn-helix domain-containing protein [Oscillospiraceae bacterium]
MDTVPIMLTISETAKRANIAEYCVRRLVKSGKIPHIKTGVKVLVNWEKFVQFLNEGVVLYEKGKTV